MSQDLLSRPGSAAYRAATTPHNSATAQQSAAVAHPHSAAEAAQAVRWAADRNLRVENARVKCGQVLDNETVRALHEAPAGRSPETKGPVALCLCGVRDNDSDHDISGHGTDADRVSDADV